MRVYTYVYHYTTALLRAMHVCIPTERMYSVCAYTTLYIPSRTGYPVRGIAHIQRMLGISSTEGALPTYRMYVIASLLARAV